MSTPEIGCFLHQLLLRRPGKRRLPDSPMTDANPDENRASKMRRHEDHPECPRPGCDPCLHRRCSCDATELQSAMRANEVVIATQQFELVGETLRAPAMTRRLALQISTASADRQIQPFDKGGVNDLGVLAVHQRGVELIGHPTAKRSRYTCNSVLSPLLDDLAVDTGPRKKLPNGSTIVLETIGRDKGCPKNHAGLEDVCKQLVSVLVCPAPNGSGGPQPRPDHDTGEYPHGMGLTTTERPDLVELQLRQLVAQSHAFVEFSGRSCRSFFPARNSIPGDLHDAGDGGLADPLYAHSGDVIEGIAAMLKPEVRGASRRGAGCPAGSAPITARPPALSNNEAVADNVSSILLTMEPAIGVRACSVSNRMSHREFPEVLPQKCFVTIATSRN